MQRRQFLRNLIYFSGSSAIGAASGGCGLIMHPERQGAQHSNQIDWKVAALDGLGLILFFVPGVIAFAVDFYTGAIYLPANNRQLGYATSKPSFKKLAIPHDELQLASIEKVISEHVKEEVSLKENGPRVSQLASIYQFETQVQRHERDRNFGHNLKAFFEPWKLRLS